MVYGLEWRQGLRWRAPETGAPDCEKSMSDNRHSKPTRRRILPRKVRRDQLIRATMKCIAGNGLSGTTMAQVTREAGLSMGIANLHFESKEKLLIETLKFVTDEYNRGHDSILASDKFPTTSARMEALLQFDLGPRVTQRTKIAVWFAFWGEAKSRPTYQRICTRTDVLAERAVSELFRAAIDEGGYQHADPELLASGYTALIDGLWLDLLVTPRTLSRKKAGRVARHYLASAFPKHIQPDP